MFDDEKDSSESTNDESVNDTSTNDESVNDTSTKSLDFTPSSYNAADLLKTKPRPMPLVTVLRMDLLSDEHMFQGVIKCLAPNGQTGNASFDKHNAVLWVKQCDADRKRNHFKNVNDGALWKVLHHVLKNDFKIMAFGKLLPAPK